MGNEMFGLHHQIVRYQYLLRRTPTDDVRKTLEKMLAEATQKVRLLNENPQRTNLASNLDLG